MWRQYKQVIRVMSKKLPTLPRGSLCIKYLNLLRDSSMPQQNKTRDKVGIDLFSGGFETLLCHWYDAMIIKLLKKKFRNLAENIFPRILGVY